MISEAPPSCSIFTVLIITTPHLHQTTFHKQTTYPSLSHPCFTAHRRKPVSNRSRRLIESEAAVALTVGSHTGWWINCWLSLQMVNLLAGISWNSSSLAHRTEELATHRCSQVSFLRRGTERWWLVGFDDSSTKKKKNKRKKEKKHKSLILWGNNH